MTEFDLATDLLINAQIRIAAKEGIPITVVRHGDNNSGTILLKINRLDGTSTVLTQVRYGDERVWTSITPKGVMTESEANAYLDQQARIDPDSWILEIEDRQGRHWFEGRILTT